MGRLVKSSLWIRCAVVSAAASVLSYGASARETTITAASPSTQPAVDLSPAPELLTTPTTRPVAAKVIRVAIYNGTGGKPLGNGEGNVARCLAAGDHFEFRFITAEQIRDGSLGGFDVLIQSGCGPGSQAKALEASGRDAIKTFVANGGGYVGICAGAYLASSEYAWSLHILNARVVDRAHSARGKGDVRVDLNDEGRALLGVASPELMMRFAQGPLFAPAGDRGLPAYEALATFGSEIAQNGAPSNVMIGTAAAATATYGKGRVLCISTHPEATAGYDGIVRKAATWASGKPE